MDRYQLGLWGEKIAQLFLEGRGFEFMQSRYNVRSGEIDLIMMDRQELVFIEVKTRTNNQFGSPEESITDKKIGRMRTAAIRYISDNRGLSWTNMRFDFVAVELNRKQSDCRIRHLTGIC